MDPRDPAPARTRAAVELITAAINDGNPALAMALFEEHSAVERDRIATIIRRKLRRAARLAARQRGYTNPDGTGRGDWIARSRRV